MENLYYSDINNSVFLRHYDNNLLLVSGNRIKFYDYEENKNIIRARNIGIYNIKDVDKNEKIVYVSNNIKLKKHRNNINENTLNNNNFLNSDTNLNKEEINYVCIAFEQGNVWLCSQEEANKLFVFEKLIYRKICDIIKIKLFVHKNIINSLILYKDSTLIFNNEKLQNSIKFPFHEYTYNFCLSNNYQNVALFNHNNLYIYDIFKSKFQIENKESNMNGDMHNTNDDNSCVEVKNIFNLSKNYKYMLNCDWHPNNHCIALCGQKSARYLTLYNYKVYDFSCIQLHEEIINLTKFISISNNVILLITLSCADYLFCIWDFELECCLYKFKSEYLVSHFDLSYFNSYLHISLLAEENHLANIKLLDKNILKKIEHNDSGKGSNVDEGSIFANGYEHTSNEISNNKYNSVNNINLCDYNNKKKNDNINNFETEDDKINKEYASSNDEKKNSNYSQNFNLNNYNNKKRKKKIFIDDDETEESFKQSFKKFAKDKNLDKENKREDKEEQGYENKKVDKTNMKYVENDDYIYSTYDNNNNNNNDDEENIYNPKEYNLQNFINKNKDVINNREENFLFENDDDQKSVIGFNCYIKEKFDQLKELKKQVDSLQKQIMNYTKINLDDFIVLVPGLCEEPENINDQWCMFWNDIGHITKKKEGNKTYIYIFLFRGEEVGRKKITDLYNVTCASLSTNGFALASNPYEKSPSKNNSILCFHNLKDNIVWNKYLPADEFIKGVANGNNFVAVVTSNNFLRIYSVYGYIINTILLKGLPVAICAYDYLLFVVTCQYIFENVSSYNLNNTYNCTLYKIYENFTNIKANKYNTYHITILYDDILSLPACHYLNWINMSNFGIPYIKDTSNYIYGLYPLFKKDNNIVYDWVPIFNLNNLNESEEKQNNYKINEKDLSEENEENNKMQNDNNNNENEIISSASYNYYPLYFDNFEQISVIKLNKNEVEPSSNKIESCLGYNVEKKYIIMSECNLIKYEKYAKLLQKNPNLSLDNDSNNDESAILPWEQYDEMRCRVDIYCKQLFINIFYDYMNDGKNKNANDTLKSLNKLYDKWIMRMFAILKNDKKNQKLAVKISRLFKNIKNMMLALSLVDDEYSTLHSELTNEYLKRQIKDENYKNYEENLNYEEDYKDEEQNRREIYEKYYNTNKNILEEEKKNFSNFKQNDQLFINSTKNNLEKKESRFLDKFFTGVTKNKNFDNLFSNEKKNTQIKKKSTLEDLFSEIKEN
ncbi:conserved Plasmodium protein, unknown function [Plasmodium gallinaceum]|uniref:WDHD1/CFT4 second beta-propeller domain-containing protein n=1 Tax=Plasmodium gallinaceum TaxID=5849 RepID=A0A1J1H281_PLAGA|nr:conserved Plasmodium protein, unknown function [Plasmodium gallinaceum]CRG97438.1 conserved Plasmodium protein, unknown function [Plasmodium gallinaceum]